MIVRTKLLPSLSQKPIRESTRSHSFQSSQIYPRVCESNGDVPQGAGKFYQLFNSERKRALSGMLQIPVELALRNNLT